MKKIIVFTLLFIIGTSKIMAQECDCNKEFLYMKDFIQKNYAGFDDNLKTRSKPMYDKMVNDFIAYSKDSFILKVLLIH